MFNSLNIEVRVIWQTGVENEKKLVALKAFLDLAGGQGYCWGARKDMLKKPKLYI